MNKIKLNLRGLDDADKIQFAIKIENGLLDNEGMPGAGPFSTQIKEKRIAFQNALSAVVDAEQTVKELAKAAEVAKDDLDSTLALAASDVELRAKGDPDKIASSGFDLRRPSRPIGEMDVPHDAELSMGDADGELNFTWGSVRGAKSYEGQICEEPVTAQGWKSARPVTKPELTFTGLTSGKRYRARLRNRRGWTWCLERRDRTEDGALRFSRRGAETRRGCYLRFSYPLRLCVSA